MLKRKAIVSIKKEIPFDYKFIDGNIGTSADKIIAAPLYMLGLLFN